jgi:hypothetical protein
MKEIQTVSIWYNGSIIAATIFNMLSINDNLTDSATFYYQLFSANNIQLANGNLTMTGSDYTTYSSSATSNDFAYSWGAAQLKLTLV